MRPPRPAVVPQSPSPHSRRATWLLLSLLLVTAALVLWFWPSLSMSGSANTIEPSRVLDLRTVEAPAGAPSESRAATASSTSDVPTIAPRLPHGIRISGEMAGASSFRLVLPGAVGSAKLHPVGADGSFAVATVPTTKCELVAFFANGALHRRSFERSDALAADDWQLGAIDFTPIECEVGLHVHCSPEVVAALLGCGRRRLAVALRAEEARGEVLGEFHFDLAAVPAGASSIEGLLRVRVAEASHVLSVSWRLVGDVAIRVPFAIGTTEYLGGNRHLARLELLPETVVRGRVLWPDGGPAIGQLLEWWPETGIHNQTVRCGAGGEFCFVVGRSGRGRIEVDRMAEVLGLAPEGRSVEAGEVVELLRGSRVRFRVLGFDGRPRADFELETGKPTREGEATVHGECAFALVGVLERFPWLRIHTAGENFTFLVPPAWLVATQDVHDLRLAEALPNGVVVVERGRAPLAPGSQLHLTGCGPIAGLTIVSSAPIGGSWRIERVPVGTYEVALESPAHKRLEALVTVPLAGTAKVMLP